jgi:hypothetical protein
LSIKQYKKTNNFIKITAIKGSCVWQQKPYKLKLINELFLSFPEHGIDEEFAELRFPGALFQNTPKNSEQSI